MRTHRRQRAPFTFRAYVVRRGRDVVNEDFARLLHAIERVFGDVCAANRGLVNSLEFQSSASVAAATKWWSAGISQEAQRIGNLFDLLLLRKKET